MAGIFVIYNIIEVVVFAIIIWQAWNWPKEDLYIEEL